MNHLSTRETYADRSKIYFSTWITGIDPKDFRIASILRIDTGNAGIQVNLDLNHLSDLRAAIDEHLGNLCVMQTELKTLQGTAQQEVKL